MGERVGGCCCAATWTYERRTDERRLAYKPGRTSHGQAERGTSEVLLTTSDPAASTLDVQRRHTFLCCIPVAICR
ncbi:hypothetical protein ANCDUO_25200 [Ancylostoma duodenale]|uniref:Uncharacterized protein n=1 Tax=Ancylostoma duodenale TaxID=51022 RepID=A0A0C2C514_9BILA|nr:hypothetical protein ANCDUO_25200 [Ancylostoma duodenale]